MLLRSQQIKPSAISELEHMPHVSSETIDGVTSPAGSNVDVVEVPQGHGVSMEVAL